MPDLPEKKVRIANHDLGLFLSLGEGRVRPAGEQADEEWDERHDQQQQYVRLLREDHRDRKRCRFDGVDLTIKAGDAPGRRG